jgi:hypothetical protein
LRQFNSSLQTPGQPSSGANGTSSPPSNNQGQAGAAPQPTGAGNTPAQAGNTPAQDDDYAGLRPDPNDPNPWLKDPNGNTVDGFAEPAKLDVEYSFCFKVVNTAIDRSGPFLIRFKLTGGDDWEHNYLMGNGLAAGGSVLACEPYGVFPSDSENTVYELEVSVISMDDRRHYYDRLFGTDRYIRVLKDN